MTRYIKDVITLTLVSLIILIFFVHAEADELQNQQKRTNFIARVLDYQGGPVEGAEVAAYEPISDYSDRQIKPKWLTIKQTDHDGIVFFSENVEYIRNIVLVARKEGLALGCERIQITSPQLITNIILQKPFVLAGKIVNNAGVGISRAKVCLFVKDSPYNSARSSSPVPHFPKHWITTETDSEGNFNFDNISPDAGVDFFVEASDYASIYTFMLYGNFIGHHYYPPKRDIQIILPRQAKITGRVIDAATGRGVHSVRLIANPYKNGYSCYSNSTISNYDGSFCIGSLTPDFYTLLIGQSVDKHDNWVGGDVKVKVSAGQTIDDVKVFIGKGAELEILALDEKTKRPLENMYLSVTQWGRFGKYYSFCERARTDKNGKAECIVPFGVCNISVGGSNYNYSEKEYLVKNNQTKLRFLLSHKPCSIGIVRDEKGKPTEGVVIEVAPFSSDYGAFLTDKNGRYDITWNKNNVVKQWYLVARDFKRNLAAIVEVNEGTNNVNITLKPAITLFGRIIEPNGGPIPAARLQFYFNPPASVASLGSEMITDDSGRYEISAVPPKQKDFVDDYRMCVVASGYGLCEYKILSITDTSKGRAGIEDIVLQPADMSVSGTIVNSTGRPVADKNIRLSKLYGNNTGQVICLALTDNKGRFEFNRVCKGMLKLTIDEEGSVKSTDFYTVAGAKDLKITLGSNDSYIPKTVSLVGMNLPELKGYDFTKASKGMTLVYVCDYYHPPSDLLLQKFKKNKKELSKKELNVVIILTTKLGQDGFKWWLQKNRIKFDAVNVEDNIPEFLQTWGVGKLPWLILADKDGLVIAEGFELNELDGKIAGGESEKN